MTQQTINVPRGLELKVAYDYLAALSPSIVVRHDMLVWEINTITDRGQLTPVRPELNPPKSH